MEIKMKYSNREVYFEDIERGEVFVYEEEAYLKLMNIYDLEDGAIPAANAVHLKSGEVCYFDGENVIRPIKVFPMEVVY